MPVTISYLIVVYMSWTAGPLFTFMLRLHPLGTLALKDHEPTASTAVGPCLVLALLGSLIWLTTEGSISSFGM